MREVEIGARLRQLRQEAGLSRPALARAAEIGESWIADFEKGRRKAPTIHTLMRIVRGLAKLTGRTEAEVLVALLQDTDSPSTPASGGR